MPGPGSRREILNTLYHCCCDCYCCALSRLSGRIVPQSSVPLNINNREGLNQALAEISQELPWVERLEVVAAESIPADHVNDDLKLELAL